MDQFADHPHPEIRQTTKDATGRSQPQVGLHTSSKATREFNSSFGKLQLPDRQFDQFLSAQRLQLTGHNGDKPMHLRLHLTAYVAPEGLVVLTRGMRHGSFGVSVRRCIMVRCAYCDATPRLSSSW
jgi:hypothetical protein